MASRRALLLLLLLAALSSSTATAFTFGLQKTLRLSHRRAPCACPLTMAKKKGGGKKKQAKKQSGMDWARSFSLKPFEAKATRDLAQTLISSFEQRTGKPLAADLKTASDAPKALWNCPVACIVVADSQPQSASQSEAPAVGESVVVKYANVAALETFGLRADEFERLLGSSDGAPAGRDASELKFPTQINGNKKFQSAYSKKVKKGAQGADGDITILDSQRWAIEQPCVIDGKLSSKPVGMAYAWSEWMLGDSVICSPGGGRRAAEPDEEAPATASAEEVEQAIEAQAAAVRELKEGQGLGNKDPEVIAAVEELLLLKAQLSELQM